MSATIRSQTGWASENGRAADNAVISRRARIGTACLLLALGVPSTSPAQVVDSSLSFFITGSSLGTGGNFGGLSGADAHCQQLADSVGAGQRVWRAYLSAQASGGDPAVNARDRIGTGPWFNAAKVKVASSVAELHGVNNLDKQTALTHRGLVVNGRGDSPNQHDVVTGTKADGTAPASGADSTCANWTSNSGSSVRAIVGHHDRMGISSNIDPQSWTEAHVTGGCTQANLQQGGGAGYFYCFAADDPATGVAPRTLRERLGAADGSAGVAPYLLGDGRRGREIVYRFTLDKPERVRISVHGMEGRRHAVLVQGALSPGDHVVRWDGTDARGQALPAGLYVIVMKRDEAD